MDQNRMPLVEALQQFREEAPAYFRIPGHRFERGLDEALNGASLAAYDLSEAEGLDVKIVEAFCLREVIRCKRCSV